MYVCTHYFNSNVCTQTNTYTPTHTDTQDWNITGWDHTRWPGKYHNETSVYSTPQGTFPGEPPTQRLSHVIHARNMTTYIPNLQSSTAATTLCNLQSSNQPPHCATFPNQRLYSSHHIVYSTTTQWKQPYKGHREEYPSIFTTGMYIRIETVSVVTALEGL